MFFDPNTDNYASAFGVTEQRATEIKQALKPILMGEYMLNKGVPIELVTKILLDEQFATLEERAVAMYASFAWVAHVGEQNALRQIKSIHVVTPDNIQDLPEEIRNELKKQLGE